MNNGLTRAYFSIVFFLSWTGAQAYHHEPVQAVEQETTVKDLPGLSDGYASGSV
ncbi:hypothetical protein GXB80_26005 [Paenibacillus polymyxa]|uniref:hypothetical protein n=1 Tax=Paenibacillus polymyxa TaxID=1406 RepID=UPI001A05D495|nr:hypothetical protein [Paenibacillus polymyxa]MBE3650968.1 hypothetical protein [Paenibacillus polymyxa]MBY7740204.1 hypothetical protein [Paenibacillus polymyxa]